MREKQYTVKIEKKEKENEGEKWRKKEQTRGLES